MILNLRCAFMHGTMCPVLLSQHSVLRVGNDKYKYTLLPVEMRHDVVKYIYTHIYPRI